MNTPTNAENEPFPILSRNTPEEREAHRQALRDAQRKRYQESDAGKLEIHHKERAAKFKGAHGIAAQATGHVVITVQGEDGRATTDTVLRSPEARRAALRDRDTPYGVERFEDANAHALRHREDERTG